MSGLQTFVPVVWTLVATFVGLVLYRTSKAVVRLKGIRVAGSAAIALLAFYGMYRATPVSAPPYQQQAEFLNHDLEDSLQSLDNAKADCLTGGAELCRRTLTTLESHLKRAEAGLKSILEVQAGPANGK